MEVELLWAPVNRRNLKLRSLKVTNVAVKWKRRPLRLVTRRVDWTNVARNSDGEFVVEPMKPSDTLPSIEWEEVHPEFTDLSLEDHTRWWLCLQSDATDSRSDSEVCPSVQSYQFPCIPLSQPPQVRDSTEIF